MKNQEEKITMVQEQQQVTYPEEPGNCSVKVYLNGYLIKTAYSIDADPKAYVAKIKADDKNKIKETEIFIELIKGDQKKEIMIGGLLREVLITTWDKIEKGAQG